MKMDNLHAGKIFLFAGAWSPKLKLWTPTIRYFFLAVTPLPLGLPGKIR
jgi:hypothetical protein